MMKTERDDQILEFLEKFHIATTSTLALKFFNNSTRRCQQRMKILEANKRVHRSRLSLNHDYYYYVRRPRSYPHKLLLTEFYKELMKRYTVITFVPAKQFGHIRPDGRFVCVDDKGKTKAGFIEIETSDNGFNYKKYENYYYSGDYKKDFPFMLPVYVVCESAKIPEDTPVKFIQIQKDFSDFRLE